MELLKNATVCTFDDAFLFGKDNNKVLSDNPNLTSIFGCTAKRISCIRRKTCTPYKEHYADDSTIWFVYKLNWTQFKGHPIVGTNLSYTTCQSCNSLSDATIYLIAVDPSQNKVVSTSCTSYWVSDRGDQERWIKRLQQKYPSQEILQELGEL